MSDAKITEMNQPSKAEQEYHKDDVSFDEKAQQDLGHSIWKGDPYGVIEPVWRPKEGN